MPGRNKAATMKAAMTKDIPIAKESTIVVAVNPGSFASLK
jgi:hypothetical protein